MTPELENLGKSLRLKREQQGLSVEDVAKVTKMSPSLVQALEAGEAARLPERVFLLHHVRAYASCVGLAPLEMQRQYESVHGEKGPAFDPKALEAERRDRATTAAWCVTAGAVLSVLGFGLVTASEWFLRFASR